MVWAPILRAPPAYVAASPPAQTDPYLTQAAALWQDLTPAERVGQLFLVTFYGSSAEAGSDIERLISQYRVGGVALLAANDNITDTLNAPAQVLALANRLQAIAAAPAAAGGTPTPTAYVPLFIATQHEGDGYPYSEVRSGLTELPSLMAIGATWEVAQAEAVGQLAGGELSALGINMVLGPSLGVLETPRPRAAGDPGVRNFGGDPFWVGQLGQGYIRGLHRGANGRLAVVAKYFPGYGSSDRNPVDEVPTARKTLDQLKLVDLLPFMAVTANSPDPAAAADAVMTAHIRYQGLQGNIGQTTRPVSLDPRALGELLAQTGAWRTNGGLTVSDSLGVRALKRFFGGQAYKPDQVALEAFNAGNDLLFLAEFGLNPPQDQARNIITTLERFTQVYASDRDFRLRVDAAGQRILALKLRLYGGRFEFAPTSEARLAELGQGDEVVLEVAQSAATRINPASEEGLEAPGPRDRIVFFTDTQVGRQCTTCAVEVLLPRTALQEAVLQFYGPAGRALTSLGNLQSFGFDELAVYLQPPAAIGPETPTPAPSLVEAALTQADWVVLAPFNDAPASPYAGLISRFLSERAELLRDKQVVVLGFGAPYYLDTTDLSKLTAYYALYSKARPFVDVAARLLFRDFAPEGDPPVSVESINYNLLQVLAPDPGQAVAVQSSCAALEAPPAEPTAAVGTPAATCRLGDTLTLQAGPFLDFNGHPVSDGTPIQFRVDYQLNNLPSVEFLDVLTVGGVAVANFPLRRVGFFDISLNDPTASAARIQLNVQQTEVEVTQIEPPTPTPTATTPPTLTPVPPTATPTLTPTPTPWGWRESGSARVEAVDFILMLGVAAGAGVVGARLGRAQPRRALRLALVGMVGAVLGYNYWALGAPGADALVPLGVLAPVTAAALGAGIALGLGWAWGRGGPATGAAGGKGT